MEILGRKKTKSSGPWVDFHLAFSVERKVDISCKAKYKFSSQSIILEKRFYLFYFILEYQDSGHSSETVGFSLPYTIYLFLVEHIFFLGNRTWCPIYITFLITAFIKDSENHEHSPEIIVCLYFLNERKDIRILM